MIGATPPPENITQLTECALDPERRSLWTCGKCRTPLAQVAIERGEVRVKCGRCGEFNTLLVR